MWTMEPKTGAARAIGAVAYLASVAAFLLVQEIGLRLRREERRAWWAGSGRDLINAAGLVAIAGSLRLLGFSGPAALVVGGTLTLAMFGGSVLVATQTGTAHPRSWSFVLGLAFAVPVLLFPGAISGAFAFVAAALSGDR